MFEVVRSCWSVNVNSTLEVTKLLLLLFIIIIIIITITITIIITITITIIITITIYNITKAKRALWLANSASTICPWVYADDVLNN